MCRTPLLYATQPLFYVIQCILESYISSCSSNLFFSKSARHPIAWMYYNLNDYFHIDGHLGFFFFFFPIQFSSVTQSCPTLCDPMNHQASLSITNSWSWPKLVSIESVMPSSHLILCCTLSSCPQSLPASGSFPMNQLFAWGGQSIGVSASASVLPMNPGLSSFRMDWVDLLFSITILQINFCVDVLMSISIVCIFSNGTIGQRICIFKIWLIQLSFPPQSLLLFIFPPVYENVYFFTLDKTLDIFRLYISVWCWHRDYQVAENTDHTFIQWWSVTVLTL